MCLKKRSPFADIGAVISGAADEFSIGVFDIAGVNSTATAKTDDPLAGAG